jgi:hypothetical protein
MKIRPPVHWVVGSATCGTDKSKTLTFVGSTWLTNVRHVVPRPPWCHGGLMFVSSPTNIIAMWQTRPPTSTPHGFYICRRNDEQKDFFKKNHVLSASQADETPKQVYNIQTAANTYKIYNNPTCQISQVSIQHHRDTSKSKHYES